MSKDNFKDLLKPSPRHLCAEGNNTNLWDKYITSVQNLIDDEHLIKLYIYSRAITITGQLPTSVMLNTRATGDLERLCNEIDTSFTPYVLERWLNRDISFGRRFKVGRLPESLHIKVVKEKHGKSILLSGDKFIKMALSYDNKKSIADYDLRRIYIGLHTVKRK